MNIPPIPLSGQKPAYREICDWVRNAILSGELAAGTRIPPVQELARQLNSSVCTVQAAFVPLVKEGLIERRQKHGTYVRNRAESLGSVGVYLGVQRLSGNDFAFYNELQYEILSELKSRGAAAKLWVDHRPSEEQTEPIPEIQRAIRLREVQGLILGVYNRYSKRWLDELNVPTSHFGSADSPGKVYLRFSEIFKLGFEELRRQGCRTAGIIASLPLSFLAHQKNDDPQYISSLANSAEQYGLP